MIDLCKIFGVEEGEEFRIELDKVFLEVKYRIKNNIMEWSEIGTEFEGDYNKTNFSVNDVNRIKNIIKLPKKKEFTDDELAIFRCIDKKYKWVTRDRRYGLTVFENKPKKITNNREEYWNASGDWLYLGCFENMFQAITTEDEEPVFIDDYVGRSVQNER